MDGAFIRCITKYVQAHQRRCGWFADHVGEIFAICKREGIDLLDRFREDHRSKVFATVEREVPDGGNDSIAADHTIFTIKRVGDCNDAFTKITNRDIYRLAIIGRVPNLIVWLFIHVEVSGLHWEIIYHDDFGGFRGFHNPSGLHGDILGLDLYGNSRRPGILDLCDHGHNGGFLFLEFRDVLAGLFSTGDLGGDVMTLLAELIKVHRGHIDIHGRGLFGNLLGFGLRLCLGLFGLGGLGILRGLGDLRGIGLLLAGFFGGLTIRCLHNYAIYGYI